MKVALIHDWLTGMRGGERCLEAFCELFPEAPIFTLIYAKGSVSSIIERHRIIPSFLSKFPFAATQYRYYLPLFPRAIQSFDLKEYDLIVSSSHCVAKGVNVPSKACHVSYLHTPMRYVWDQYENYFGPKKCSVIVRTLMGMYRSRLQQWDIQSNANIHCFLANSHNVADRIERHYGRESWVVHPPLRWEAFEVSHSDEGFYLMVTAFAPYKRVDLAIEAANVLGCSMKIIGHGQDGHRLKKMAGKTVEFLGWQPDHRVRDLYSKCRAVVFPGEEDFGIVPLEAMATGKPVIAFGKGGVRETVNPLNPMPEEVDNILHKYQPALQAVPNQIRANTSQSVRACPIPLNPPTGVFFYEQTASALVNAVKLFERHRTEFNPEAIRGHVQAFDQALFQPKVRDIIMKSYHEFRRSVSC